MVERMKDKEIKEFIEKGYLKINVIFEVVGNPKNHVEDSLKAYIANIKTQEGIVVLREDYDDVQEVNEGVFSIVAESEMLVKDFEKLTWLCINFTPASIEIIEPDELKIEQKSITHWLNDLLSSLHEIGIVHKKLASEYQGVLRNFNAMTRNAILLVLKEPSDIKTISEKVGMIEEHTEKFLEALITEKKITKEKNIYHLLR